MIRSQVPYLFSTKPKNIQASLKDNKDFVVKEVPLPFKMYERKGGKVEKIKGTHTLLKIRKTDMNTEDVRDFLAKKYNLNKKDVTFSGNKDKNAVTEQWFSLKLPFKDFKEIYNENIKIIDKKPFNKRLFKGDLKGNEFQITLHLNKNKDLNKTIEYNKKNLFFLPNYFGVQRFSEKNHIIGYYLIKDPEKASELLKKDYRKINKEKLKFYIHAFQSFIFNKTLHDLVEKKKKIDKIPLVGWQTKSNISDYILKELDITKQDFKKSDIKVLCPRGSERKAFISVDLGYKINKQVVLKFFLPKGSYATVVLEALFGGYKDLRKDI